MKLKRQLEMVVLLLATLFVSASFASTALATTTTTWSGEQPAANSSVVTKPGQVSVNASSSGVLSASSARMTVDGVVYQCFVTNPNSTSGHWVQTEVWDDEDETWVTSSEWVLDPDLTKASLLTYAWNGPLGNDGSHTVVASIKDADGHVVSDTWTFAVKVPPKIGTPTPANGSTVSTTSPVISVPVSDNGTVTSWDVTVNGVAATATLSGGVLHITPASRLTNDSVATIALTIRDAVGATASKTWSFNVQLYGEMANMRDQCLECHPGYDSNPDMTPDCEVCHNGVLDYPHFGNPSSFHVRADITCGACHLTSLPTEHARRVDTGGNPLTCMTCHKSQDSKVKNAVASRNSNCRTCHDGANSHDGIGSPTKHVPSPVSAACLMSGCHATASIAVLHSNVTTTVAGTVRSSCAICHVDSTLPSPVCSTCHTDKLDSKGRVKEHGVDPVRHIGSDAVVRGPGDTGFGCSDGPGKGCHDISNLPRLHLDVPGGPCAVCHGDGKTPSTNCRSCHPRGKGLPTANTLAGTDWYHHQNVKYLNDSSDATTSPYYWLAGGSPSHGWNETLFVQDCTTNCHLIHAPR